MGWVSLALLATHFSMVGFAVDGKNAESMGADLGRYAERCQPVRLDGDDYLCIVRDSSGAEIWIGSKKLADDRMSVVTVNPALQGEGRTDVVVAGDVSDAQWKPFEVAVQVRFGEDEVPLVIDLADPREAASFAPGAKLSVDLTAFADALTLHDSEAAYLASQDDREIKLAPAYFIPSGMFGSGDEPPARPTAHALFAGRIVRSELRRNLVGNGGYWWMLVETYGGALVNVVADPETVTGSPKAGGHIEGQFWISGRLRKS